MPGYGVDVVDSTQELRYYFQINYEAGILLYWNFM